MPKPSKPSSAPARAQGLGNKPNNYSRGDTNQREVHILFKSHDSNYDEVEKKCDSTVKKIDVADKGIESNAKKLIGTIETNAENEIFKPNNEQVANKPWSNAAHLNGNAERLQCYKDNCKMIGDKIKAGLAKPDPERPFMSVGLEGRCFVLHKGITNEAIDEFVAAYVSFYMKKKDGFKSEGVEEDKWANVIKKLTSIAFEIKGKPIWVNEDGTEEPFTDTSRDNLYVSPIGQKPKRDSAKLNEEIKKSYEEARYYIDLMKKPNAVAVVCLGKHYVLRENRETTNIEEFFWKLVKFVKADKVNEDEKCNILNLLKTFCDEVVEPVVVERCGVAVTLDNSDLNGEDFGVTFNEIDVKTTQEVPINERTDKKGLDPKEPKEAIAIEVDQYEEVDGIDQNNTKSKCVIS